jgi:NADPH:quinone reductase-like Zn-dependent oxidoreductase
MKAIGFKRYGGAEQLEPREVPKPVPGDDELLVRIHASSVNSWDWEFLNGTPYVNRLMYGLLRPRPAKQVLGADIAGTVEAVGKRVRRFRPGDAVFGDLWDHWGGFAEYACAHESAMEPKPESITFEEAAAVPQAGVLALQGVRKARQLRRGQKVLINGAGGGVGTFAIQLVRLAGAEVTGVDATHKLDVIRELGADHVIDYALEDFTKTGVRYDLIIDCQNFRSMYDNRRALTRAGVYAMVGGSTLRVLQLGLLNAIAPLARDSRKLCLVAGGPNKGLAELSRLIDAGKITPVIGRVFRLDEAADAFRYFSAGRHKGKIVIAIRD